jgi:hypothetical protein
LRRVSLETGEKHEKYDTKVRQLRDLRVRGAEVGSIERRQDQSEGEPGDELPQNRGLAPASGELTTHLGCDQHDRSFG